MRKNKNAEASVVYFASLFDSSSPLHRGAHLLGDSNGMQSPLLPARNSTEFMAEHPALAHSLSRALCKCAEALLSSPMHNARSLRQGRSLANWPPPNKSSPWWQIVQPSSISRDMMWRLKRTGNGSALFLSSPLFFFFLLRSSCSKSLRCCRSHYISHINTAVR